MVGHLTIINSDEFSVVNQLTIRLISDRLVRFVTTMTDKIRSARQILPSYLVMTYLIMLYSSSHGAVLRHFCNGDIKGKYNGK